MTPLPGVGGSGGGAGWRQDCAEEKAREAQKRTLSGEKRKGDDCAPPAGSQDAADSGVASDEPKAADPCEGYKALLDSTLGNGEKDPYPEKAYACCRGVMLEVSQ